MKWKALFYRTHKVCLCLRNVSVEGDWSRSQLIWSSPSLRELLYFTANTELGCISDIHLSCWTLFLTVNTSSFSSYEAGLQTSGAAQVWPGTHHLVLSQLWKWDLKFSQRNLRDHLEMSGLKMSCVSGAQCHISLRVCSTRRTLLSNIKDVILPFK